MAERLAAQHDTLLDLGLRHTSLGKKKKKRKDKRACLLLQGMSRSVARFGTSPGAYSFSAEGNHTCYNAVHNYLLAAPAFACHHATHAPRHAPRETRVSTVSMAASIPLLDAEALLGCFTYYVVATQDEYVSGALHHVVIGAGANGPLQPDTTYYYSCGDPDLGMSPEFSFTSPPETGPDSFPYRSSLLPGGWVVSLCGPWPALGRVHMHGNVDRELVTSQEAS